MKSVFNFVGEIIAKMRALIVVPFGRRENLQIGSG